MGSIKLDLSNSFVGEELNNYENKVNSIVESLKKNNMTGWLDCPSKGEEIEKIKKIVERLKEHSEYLICIGIGGSYLGAKAIIDALGNNFLKSKVIYAGNNIDSDYMYELLDFIKDKEYSINVISKSGTTLEPSLAFRLLKEKLKEKYNDNYKERIIVTTDASKGLLKKMAINEGYETLIIPDNIGGRYSVLTPVGLLPLAFAGIDIDALLKGFENAKIEYSTKFNDCYKYAITRYLLDRQGKNIEMLVNYNPKLVTFSEWWKQLFGESEGKEGKGLFPVSVNFTTDLHSLGQYIQEGKRIMFETVIDIEKPQNEVFVPKVIDSLDNLDYLEGYSFDSINKKAMQGTIEAHIKGNVPNIKINVTKLDEESLGELIYFFFLSCAISCSLNDVDPFNQPGVEEYKKNMFRLLKSE